jgi:hypothetical protein
MHQSNTSELTPSMMKEKLEEDANDLVDLVVKPAFKTITDIIDDHGAQSMDLQAKKQAITEYYSTLTQVIARYKENLSTKYAVNVPIAELDTKLKLSYIEIRNIITDGLAKLIHIREQIPPDINLSPLISVEHVLVEAAAVFTPVEQTWTGWLASYMVTFDKSFSTYCTHLEKYVRLTYVNNKANRIVEKVSKMIEKRVLDENLKKTYLNILNKIKNDFLKDVENIQINLCQVATVEEDIRTLEALDSFVISQYKSHYQDKVDVIFNRFLQNMNIVSS